MRIDPMLAVAAAPFDSPEYLFEVKWDGIRGLAAVKPDVWRLWGRGADDYTGRYPELEVVRQLPVDTVLDGELVQLTRQGTADFAAVLARHQLTSTRKIRWAARRAPVTYLVFDLLRLQGQCLLRYPLTKRRQLLEELLAPFHGPPLRLAEIVIGAGTTFFERAVGQGHEGIMAKRLDSHYRPGRRSPAWRKIKPRGQTVCVILGYRRRRDGRLASLPLGAQRHGALRYVGQLRGGDFSPQLVDSLLVNLAARHCAQPVVPCPTKARWVRPEIYCQVRHFGWTQRGRLRFPSPVRLLAPPAVCCRT